MKLYYLIRKYAKETEDAGGQENFTDEVLDLAFLDKVKKEQIHNPGGETGAVHDKFLRRKALKKTAVGSGDLAELDNEDES